MKLRGHCQRTFRAFPQELVACRMHWKRRWLSFLSFIVVVADEEKHPTKNLLL